MLVTEYIYIVYVSQLRIFLDVGRLRVSQNMEIHKDAANRFVGNHAKRNVWNLAGDPIYIYIYIIQSSTTQCKLQKFTWMQVTPKIITLRYII